MFARAGISVTRATLSNWLIKSTDLLTPLVRLMEADINDYDIAYADETSLQILKEKDRAHTPCSLQGSCTTLFVDVAKAHKKQGLAHQIVALIGKLYQIERELKDKDATPALVFMTRVKKSRPILLQIKALLDDAQLKVPPKSPLGAALFLFPNALGSS
jgi:hypothetical protein